MGSEMCIRDRTRRLGGAVDQSPPQPTTPDEPPFSTQEALPQARESAPEIVLDEAPAVEISEAELAELTEAEAAELEQLDVDAVDVEIVEDDETAPEDDTQVAEAAAEERAVEPPTMPRPELRAEEAPTSDIDTEPRPPAAPVPEPVTQQRPPIADDATSPSEAASAGGAPVVPSVSDVETTRLEQDKVTPPPLPDVAAAQQGSAPAGAARPGSTLTSGDVLVQAPPSPEPAPTLEVGDMVVKPRRVEPQLLQKDNVGEFIAEVRKMSEATFGEVLDASLELGEA